MRFFPVLLFPIRAFLGSDFIFFFQYFCLVFDFYAKIDEMLYFVFNFDGFPLL